MHRFTRCVVVSIFSASLFLLGGCFPTDNNNPTSPTPNPIDTTKIDTTKIDTTKVDTTKVDTTKVDTTKVDSLHVGDKPTDLPTDVNTSANTSDAGIDSMFNLLITRTKQLDNLNSQVDLYAIDFTSLRKGFAAAINKSPNHIKANVGFIVSSVLSINGNKDIQKVIDSIDTYVNDMDAYYNESDPYLQKRALSKTSSLSTGFLAKTYASHGLLSAGQALVAETPKILMAQTSRPSFPRFLTLSYIQNTIESGVLPRLNEVIAATQRLKAISNVSLPVTIDGETTELDLGDILILEGTVRAARAGFTMMLIYDTDIYSPNGTNDMRWIDEYAAALDTVNYKSKQIYSLHSDTLYNIYYTDNTPALSYISDVYQYNYGRSGFLSIRKNYHLAVYNDLKEIPVLFKAGLTAIKNEADNQDNDLIPAMDIADMSEEMSSFSKDMLEEGFTPGFASKFQSPEALMDFISLVLTGPYNFSENIDDKQITITVDLSKFFTNPANSLKDYWPKYRLPTASEKYVSYSYYSSVSSWTSKSFNFYNDSYDSVQVDIPSSLIDSISKSLYSYSTTYYLKNKYNYTLTKDSIRTIAPIIYLDDNGKAMNYYDLIYQDVTKQTLPKVFPYFNDYTFKGIFPNMTTRKNWIDFFGVFVE